MKELNDPSVIANGKEMAKRRAEQWWIGWANNLDASHIIAIGKEMYDWDIDKVNEVLVKKWFEEIDHFPERDEETYNDDIKYPRIDF